MKMPILDRLRGKPTFAFGKDREGTFYLQGMVVALANILALIILLPSWRGTLGFWPTSFLAGLVMWFSSVCAVRIERLDRSENK